MYICYINKVLNRLHNCEHCFLLYYEINQNKHEIAISVKWPGIEL